MDTELTRNEFVEFLRTGVGHYRMRRELAKRENDFSTAEILEDVARHAERIADIIDAQTSLLILSFKK